MAEENNRPGSENSQKIIDKLIETINFIIVFFKYVGTFFLGIVVGMGLVLKNPEEKKQEEKINWKVEKFKDNGLDKKREQSDNFKDYKEHN